MDQTKYILKQTIKDEKAVVKVFCPVLSDHERAKRMKRIHDAAELILKDAERKKQK